MSRGGQYPRGVASQGLRLPLCGVRHQDSHVCVVCGHCWEGGYLEEGTVCFGFPGPSCSHPEELSHGFLVQ